MLSITIKNNFKIGFVTLGKRKDFTSFKVKITFNNSSQPNYFLFFLLLTAVPHPITVNYKNF